MPSSSDIRHHMPFQPEVPAEARRQAEEVSADWERRMQDAYDDSARRLTELTEVARSRLRDLLGAESWLALRRFMQGEHVAFRNLWQPPEGLTLDFAEQNRARVERATAFAQGLGASAEQLRAIGREYATGVREVMSGEGVIGQGFSLEHHQDRWRTIFGRHWDDAFHYFWPPPDPPPPPPPPPPPDPHRWFTFAPPFSGFQTGWHVPLETGAFRVARQHILDPAAGLVGNDVTMENGDASDIDIGHGIAHTQIAFFFEAPTTGLVEVVIHAQSGLATHDLHTEDEFGWSDSETRQINSLMMHVLHPNVTGPSFARMSRFEVKTDGTTSVHREFLARGGNYVADLFSDGPIPGGQIVAIRAGTESRDYAFTNDIEIYSTSRFHWFIKAVHVRIAP